MLRRRPIGPTLVNTWHQQVATITIPNIRPCIQRLVSKRVHITPHTPREALLRPTQQRWGVADGGIGFTSILPVCQLKRRPIGPTTSATSGIQPVCPFSQSKTISTIRPCIQFFWKTFTHYLERECTLRHHTPREACLRPTQQRWGVANGGMGSRIPRHPANKSAKKGGPRGLQSQQQVAFSLLAE